MVVAQDTRTLLRDLMNAALPMDLPGLLSILDLSDEERQKLRGRVELTAHLIEEFEREHGPL